MNTLIKSIEEWVDQRVFANNEYFVAKFKEMEELHIRDAERIAELELKALLYLDSSKADAGESMHEADQMLSELVDRVDDVESSLEDKIDTVDVDEMVDTAVNDIDVESRIIDAVQSEIDAIDFKITVER